MRSFRQRLRSSQGDLYKLNRGRKPCPRPGFRPFSQLRHNRPFSARFTRSVFGELEIKHFMQLLWPSPHQFNSFEELS
eukprot:3995895-Amphidinium_carterae.1